jgi:hypothetical protein
MIQTSHQLLPNPDIPDRYLIPRLEGGPQAGRTRSGGWPVRRSCTDTADCVDEPPRGSGLAFPLSRRLTKDSSTVGEGMESFAQKRNALAREAVSFVRWRQSMNGELPCSAEPVKSTK